MCVFYLFLLLCDDSQSLDCCYCFIQDACRLLCANTVTDTTTSGTNPDTGIGIKVENADAIGIAGAGVGGNVDGNIDGNEDDSSGDDIQSMDESIDERESEDFV